MATTEHSPNVDVVPAIGVVTPEDLASPWFWPKYGPNGRSCFVYDEQSGKLVVRPSAYRKIDKALNRAVRRMKFSLYRELLGLYFLELRFKARLTILRIRCKASSCALLWY